MKTFRIVFGILALIPLALLMDLLFLRPENYGEGSIGELVFLVVGIPILIFNMWAWIHPELLKANDKPGE